MRYRFLLLLCACWATAAADAAQAQDAPPPAKEAPAIHIKGLRNPEDLAYASFVAAQQAYEENRRYAPDAPLLFQIKSHSGQFDGLRITIAGDNTFIPVPYDEAGQFTVPYDKAALQDDAMVTTDKKHGELYWLPVIRTPGLPPDTLRLGDLRLSCRVSWALEKGDASIATRMMWGLMGGCNSNSFTTLGLPQPGMLVRLVSGDKAEVLAVKGGDEHYVAHRTRWQPPLGDAAWPDDTRVEFLPPEDGFELDAECREAREKDASDAYRHSYGTFSASSCVWRPN